MPIDRTLFNLWVDDDGSNTVGTLINKSRLATDLLDVVDDAVTSMLSPLRYGAVGDGSTDDTTAFTNCLAAARTAKTGVTVPPLIYKISSELDIGGVSVIGQSSGLAVDSFPGPMWPTFKPTSAVTRLFRVGPRDAADVTAGFTDRAFLKRIKIDLANAATNCVAIGSTYGVAMRILEDIHIRGVAGSVASKNFTGIRYVDDNIATNIAAYNTFRRVQILHCNKGFDIAGDFSGNNRYDECVLEQCYVWNAYQYFTIFGHTHTLNDCGAMSFEADFDPVASSHWIVKIGGPDIYSNVIDGFSIDGQPKRPYFFVNENTQIRNVRGILRNAHPLTASGAPDYIQVIDTANANVGPQTSHGPAMLSDDMLRAAFVCAPHVHQNLIPNGNFESWINGASFTNPATATAVMAGFTAVRNGTDSYTLSKYVTPGIGMLTHAQSLRMQVTSATTGVNGFRINLENFYPFAALRTLNKFCVGMLFFITGAEDTLQGAYIKVDDGVLTSEEVETFKYDGTKGFGSLRQEAGKHHVLFVNHTIPGNATKLELTFGLKKDGTHDGLGDFYIMSVFCYPGWYDAYTAWPVIQPTPLNAWNALAAPLYAVLGPVSASWTPGSIGSDDAVSTTVTVSGAAFGDPAQVAYDKELVAGLTISANVSAADTVRVTIANHTAGSVTPTAGNVKVVVLKFSAP